MPKRIKYRVAHPRLLDFNTPNELPNAVTAEHEAALATACRFLGKVFYEGDTICYDSSEWVCSGGDWQKTGRSCG
jgi:hypothetical protein